jgi:hypothetical protein
MWWRVSPSSAMVGMGLLRPSEGPGVASKCGGHVARRPGMCSMHCHAETVTLRSRDYVGFRKGCAMRTGDMYGGGTGGVDTSSWCRGVCTRCGEVCGGFGGACISL